jgi:prevent-host-death family protein
MSEQNHMPKKIKAADFKAKCLIMMDQVARTGRRVIITKNGKPIVEGIPYRPRKNALGILKDSLFITGDIISPIDIEWDALK